jgi:hypothetical protein
MGDEHFIKEVYMKRESIREYFWEKNDSPSKNELLRYKT